MIKQVLVRLVVPLALFFGAFLHSVGFLRVAASCDCFYNFRDLIIVLLLLVFFVGVLMSVYRMRKNKIEYTFSHTIKIIGLFSIIYFTIMTLGQVLYIPSW